MSNIPPIDTSLDLPITYNQDHTTDEHSLQPSAASSSTFPGASKTINLTSSTDLHHEGSSNNDSTAQSPDLDRNRQRPLHKECQESAEPVDNAPNGFNEVTDEDYERSPSLAGYGSNNFRQRAGAQQEPVQQTLSDASNTSTHSGGNSRGISPAGWLKKQCEDLRRKQEDIQINIDGPSRTPVPADFPPALSMKIISPDQPVESCIILMHNLADNEASLNQHVHILKSKQPQSAFVLLRGLQPIGLGNSGYHWADANGTVDEGFVKTSRVLLEDIIQDGLMAKCSFNPRDIVVLGHGQGGMAALAATACWNCIEFGGVISFGGPMPGYVQLPLGVKAKTPALIYGATHGAITPTALQHIKDNFSFVDHHTPPSGYDTIPISDMELVPLLEFFAHRLGREEWKRQAVISFDGGGIRGYGSLLILQELMNKIGILEKSLDGTTESSFSPCDYKPTTANLANTSGASANSLPSQSAEPSAVGAIGPTVSHHLPNSALFLPCHYFTYAAGSSTGGLISIMLSRFRMTVDDCIKEYKTLGKKIFGQPRRMAKGGFPWHRFSATVLKDVIRDVTSSYNRGSGHFRDHYGMESTDEDKCQCIVLAYADHSRGEFPYIFRTYGNQAPPWDPSRPRNRQRIFRNPGGPSILPIWKVARATSAAPGYFSPTKIRTGQEVIRFKDGGFGTNNPSEEAYWDILNKHGSILRMGPFISIGTGITPMDMFSKRSDNLSIAYANLKTAVKLPARTLRAHENMIRNADSDGEERFPYFRFDGGVELGEIDLGEWETHRFTRITGKDGTSGRKTLKKIEAAIAVYLRKPDVERDLTECAKLLVNRRRLRARNASDWDRYASYSHYVCDMKGCPERVAGTALEFKEHLRRRHKLRLADTVIEKKVSECRRVQWLYP